RQRLGVTRARGFGGGALRRREHVNAGAVLRADIVALAHALGRVMIFPERLQQPLVRDFLWIVDHQHDLVVAGTAAANFLVGRIGREAASITDRGDIYGVAKLPELALRAPEAAKSEHRHRQPLRIWPFEPTAVDEMF